MSPARALVLACIPLLTSCSKGPWDGKAVALEEKGDWVDPGPLATCGVWSNAEGVACGSLESFDLSRCDRDSLEDLDRHGVYRAELRYELPDYGPGGEVQGTRFWGGSGGFRLDANGTAELVHGRTPREHRSDAKTWLLAGSGPDSWGRDERYTYVACNAPGDREVRGCFSICNGGLFSYGGTFRAERMVWGRDEHRASGGLEQRSESRVEPGTPVDVYVTKNHAYVVSVNAGDRPGGLTVFDVSDRKRPVLRKSLSLPDDSYWNGVWAQGDALYIASDASGVIVYDISHPADPVHVRNVPGGPPLNVHTVFVEGGRLYAMSPSPNGETLVFDVSTPLSPTLLNRISAPEADPYSYPHDAFAYEGRLYINHTTSGYHVYDVSNVAAPTPLGTYAYENAYSHANAVGTFAGRTIAFEGGERLGAHLRVLDVTDPAHIIKIGEYRLRGVASIHNMVLVGTRLYVAYYHEGLRVLDVSNPTEPEEIAHFNTYRDLEPGRGDSMYEGAIGIRVPGDGHVYVVDTARGLLIFNEP